jgi:hypothetical protein
MRPASFGAAIWPMATSSSSTRVALGSAGRRARIDRRTVSAPPGFSLMVSRHVAAMIVVSLVAVPAMAFAPFSAMPIAGLHHRWRRRCSAPAARPVLRATRLQASVPTEASCQARPRLPSFAVCSRWVTGDRSITLFVASRSRHVGLAPAGTSVFPILRHHDTIHADLHRHRVIGQHVMGAKLRLDAR